MQRNSRIDFREYIFMRKNFKYIIFAIIGVERINVKADFNIFYIRYLDS